MPGDKELLRPRPGYVRRLISRSAGRAPGASRTSARTVPPRREARSSAGAASDFRSRIRHPAPSAAKGTRMHRADASLREFCSASPFGARSNASSAELSSAARGKIGDCRRRGIGDDRRQVAPASEALAKAPRLLSAATLAAAQRHAIVAGQRAHPPRTAVEQGLAVAVWQAGDQPANAPEAFAEAALRTGPPRAARVRRRAGRRCRRDRDRPSGGPHRRGRCRSFRSAAKRGCAGHAAPASGRTCPAARRSA